MSNNLFYGEGWDFKGPILATTGTFSGAVAAASFSGSGASLTGVPLASITGLGADVADYLAIEYGLTNSILVNGGAIIGSSGAFSGNVTATSVDTTGENLMTVSTDLSPIILSSTLAGAAVQPMLQIETVTGYDGLLIRARNNNTTKFSVDELGNVIATSITFSGHTLVTNGVIYTLPGVTASLAPLANPTFTGTITIGGTIAMQANANSTVRGGVLEVYISTTRAAYFYNREAAFDRDWNLTWSSSVGTPGASIDSNISRISAGLFGVGTGALGSIAGGFSLTTLIIAQRTPASAAASGVANTICFDADYIYVCTSTNSWKRAAIATW